MIDRGTIPKKPPGTRRTPAIVLSLICSVVAVFSVAACGKKGPPLPPLVKLPVPPADLTAARRGNTVAVSFSVPAANTDGTRPANVQSTEVYAITAPVTVPPLSDANLLKYGTKVASVAVKAPRDPNLTADADDPGDEVDPAEGPGLDQGAVARVTEPLTLEMLKPIAVPHDKKAPAEVGDAGDGPLVGPAPRTAAHVCGVRHVDSRQERAVVETRHGPARPAAAAAFGRDDPLRRDRDYADLA